MSEELKPCPRCGNKYGTPELQDVDTRWRVMCVNMLMEYPIMCGLASPWCYTKEDAIKWWNEWPTRDNLRFSFEMLQQENQRLIAERDAVASELASIRKEATETIFEYRDEHGKQYNALKICRENRERLISELAELQTKHDNLRFSVEMLQKENARLRAEVEEWLCVDCRIVYPGPPQPGVRCVICPKCGGDTMPRASAEIERLTSELESAHKIKNERAALVEELRAEIASIRKEATETIFKSSDEYSKQYNALKICRDNRELLVAENERLTIERNAVLSELGDAYERIERDGRSLIAASVENERLRAKLKAAYIAGYKKRVGLFDYDAELAAEFATAWLDEQETR